MADSSLRAFARTARHPPLWARWMMTIAVFALVIAAIAIIARSGGSESNGSSPSEEALAVAEANSEGRTAIAEDEAPHSSRLPPGIAVQPALQSAIVADVRSRIRTGQLTGPLQSVSCRASGPAKADRLPYSCTVRSAGIAYLFVGVADERALELTWCKVDPPPAAKDPLEVPVSPRCRA
ncbi:MAG TPA: hypothetical protein VN892_10510 [Solirubrobacteraceae bacterium]|nr:hypothetical protein [Solirubrobacteraceae bacterium]